MADNINIEKLQELSDNIDAINANVELGSAEAINILDETNNKIEEVEAEKTPTELCNYTEKIKKIAELIEKFKTYAEYIRNINYAEYLAGLSENIVQPIKNKIALLSLKIKKIIIWIQLSLAKIKRRLILLVVQGKIAPALQAIFGTIIIAIQLIFTVINAIIKILETIIAMIPFLFALTAEGMAFFLTPRSMKSTQMNILNLNQSNSRVIPTPVLVSINEILEASSYANAAIKQSAMVSSISQSMIAALNNNVDSGIVVVDADITGVAREKLLLAINLLLAVLPLVEPLPKYERLPMWKNLGYFLWLLTGWCPAGRASFGLPGI